MGNVIVWNFDACGISTLKANADLHGQSFEVKLWSILSTAALPNTQEGMGLTDPIRQLTLTQRQMNSTALV